MGFFKTLANPHHNKTNPTATSSLPKVNTGTTEKVPSKYLKDPVRTSNQPDTVGSFVDPMGGRDYYDSAVDVTNTGA